MPHKLDATHGTICSMPKDTFGYFGWPSVTRMDDGTLVAAASGLRNEHVCPFGRTVLCRSHDNGQTWTTPRVVNDSPLDDRDTGILSLGGQHLLVTWFTSDNRKYVNDTDPQAPFWRRGLIDVNDESAAVFAGSWLRRSRDGGNTWEAPMRLDISAPHGPIRLADGDLLYLGKEFGWNMEKFANTPAKDTAAIIARRSADGGRGWKKVGSVPICPGTGLPNYHEPHVVGLPDGKLIGMIRFQDYYDAPKAEALGLVSFSLMQTESTDGGQTWSPAKPLGFHGSPPHLLRHSSGVLVCSYGYRLVPFGQRVALSRDDGATWDHDWVLRDDGPDSDLGYPCSEELDGGEILTVYYQKPAESTDKCALLYSRWRLP